MPEGKFVRELSMEYHFLGRNLKQRNDNFQMVGQVTKVFDLFQEFLSTQMGSVSGYRAWLGLTYDTESKQWRWYDNSTVNPDVM